MREFIPRILHRSVPTITSSTAELYWWGWKELHPGWVWVTWRDPLDAKDWETGHLWQHCVAGAQIGGMIRLEVLWRFGGIYLDSDIEPVRALLPLLADRRAFACREDEWCIPDFVLGAPRRHPAIRECIDRVLALPRHELVDPKRGPWVSGPGVTTAVFSVRPDVRVLPPVSFAPYHWSNKARDEGKDWASNPETYGIHRWDASWVVPPVTGRRHV